MRVICFSKMLVQITYLSLMKEYGISSIFTVSFQNSLWQVTPSGAKRINFVMTLHLRAEERFWLVHLRVQHVPWGGGKCNKCFWIAVRFVFSQSEHVSSPLFTRVYNRSFRKMPVHEANVRGAPSLFVFPFCFLFVAFCLRSRLLYHSSQKLEEPPPPKKG